jgi:dephospho-CoA kinase
MAEAPIHGRPLLAGLTGGIAAGKTLVASMLAEHGAAVVDADQIAREIMTPAFGVLERVVARFGRRILTADGALDREALGQIVFSDSNARHQLEAITHPAIATESLRLFQQHYSAGHRVVVYEAALLVETGRFKALDLLVVVVADEHTRLLRLARRSGLLEQEARRRMAAQLSDEQKVACADHVIDNSGSLEQTRDQVRRVWRAITSRIGDLP